MPLIDVTEVLTDPMLGGERFTVIRRHETVDDFGRSRVTQQRFPNVVGNVVPTGDNSVIREEGYTAQSNVIQVHTKFRLRGPSKDPASRRFQPDIVLTRDGTSYVVSSINDYTSYGAGFTQAICTSIDLADMSPY